jgi:hypothetical protein
MKKIILATCLLFVFNILRAQVPGYLGKRTVVEVQGMLPFFAVNFDGYTPLYVKAHAEYAIKRKRSVSLEYRLVNGPKVDGADGGFSHTAVVAMYGLYRKNWSLAPYGKYVNFGLGYNILKVQATGTGDPNRFNKNFFSAHIAWGQRFVIAKRVSFNYGCEMGTPLNGGDDVDVLPLMLFNMNLGVGFLF